MAVTTLGSGDIAARVEETIKRRGADATSVAMIWTSLAAAGGLLAVAAMFVTWYADVRTATAWYSGFMPPIALLLVLAGAAVLVGKQLFGRTRQDIRVNADLFLYAIFVAGALVLMLRQVWKGDLDNGVYLLAVPLVGLVLAMTGLVQKAPQLSQPMASRAGFAVAALAAIALIRQLVRGDLVGAVYLIGILLSIAILVGLSNVELSRATLELEQVALGLASLGAGLIILKRMLDAEFATGGWAWGLLAALAVVTAALAACQYLGILSMFQVALFVALSLSVVILVVLLAQVVGDGWPVLSERLNDFWSGTLRSRSEDDQLGISQGILGSFWIAVFVVVLAFPIGIAAAVYLEEYAPRNRFTSTLDIVVRNLAGVPSVVYGLLGLFLFVKGTAVTHWFIDRINSIWQSAFGEEEFIEVGQSTLFAGGVTLAILVLPIVIITAAEAVRAVPQSLREGAYGVGATKWEVIKSQVLPFAAPGILTGTLLALSRAVGEAAPLILVGAITGRLAPRDSMFGGLNEFFGQFADRFTAMPIIIVGWVRNAGVDKGFGPAAGAAIVMLLVFVILMNSVAVLLRNYFEKKRA
ncbi:MAG: phosphate ABC transporter permease PstA [Acidimicrobiaceae bacterium]|jgi:phosphate transport system permease protein|nr:phosphate ABC transporter permease PstA [Acidimicrobiaceae bacterium]